MSRSLIEELEVAIAHGSPDRCADMVRRITDLFIADSIRYSDDEIAVFDDVLVRLAAEIEISARALLASRLAPIPNAPPNVIRKLALDDEADVACPVLARSERLDDATLVRCAGTKDQRHLLAIALRSSLSEAVTDILVDRGDRQVALSTAENSGARISDVGFSVLISRSHGDDRLAEIVGSRTELPPHLFLKLLATASRAVQMKLEAEHPQARREIYRVVTEVSNSHSIRGACAIEGLCRRRRRRRIAPGVGPALGKQCDGVCQSRKVRRDDCRTCALVRSADRSGRAGDDPGPSRDNSHTRQGSRNAVVLCQGNPLAPSREKRHLDK